MTAVDGEHRLGELRLDPTDGFVAICVCGWISPRMPTAGLAHAAMDRHADTRPDG